MKQRWLDNASIGNMFSPAELARILPLGFHLQGTLKVGDVQSYAHQVGVAESMCGRRRQYAKKEMLKVDYRALECLSCRSRAWEVKTLLWLAKGLPKVDIIDWNSI